MEHINGRPITGATTASLSGVASDIITIDGIVDAIQSTLSDIATDVISITGFATSASLSEVLAISTKQAGSIGVGSTIASWNAAEADVVSIGANDTKYKLHSLMLDMNELDTGATISIRMYSQINGTERKLYDEDYVVGTDPDGIWLVDGTVGIHEVLRVTAESSAATDDGASIGYDYILEGM